MAAKSKAKSKKVEGNGHANGHLNNHSNGHLNGSANGKPPSMNGTLTSKPSKPSPARTQAFLSRFISNLARLALWYTILTALFRCPSSISAVDENSPTLCKPYFTARSYVAPYVEPYYNTYLAQHVGKAQPYVDTFNQRFYTPAASFAKKNYNTFGAPRVQLASTYAESEWVESVKPYLVESEGKLRARYDAVLAPHVNKVSEALAPHYNAVASSLKQQYNSRLYPAYTSSLPYAQKIYNQGHHVTVKIVFPYIRWATSSIQAFFLRTIWPQVRILYGENVEPQLMRISERLGRYRDGKKLEAVVSSVESSMSASTTDETPSSSSLSTSVAISEAIPNPEASKKPSRKDDPEVRAKIETDLKQWQEKFAKAADKGADDLEERVKEITARQIDNQAHGVGGALVTKLEQTADLSIAKLKHIMIDILNDLPENASEEDNDVAYERVLRAVRSAGESIRDQAQAIRSWKENYDKENQKLVQTASDSTLDVIDNIRDLGLQEIGMRWAWMEGVTYKDWSKYHALKKTFDEWRDEVQAVALEHDGLHAAQEEGAKIEEQGMTIAESAAKELTRLKGVAQWKIEAKDSTDDFTSKNIPAAAAKAGQKIKEKISEASSSVIGTSTGSVESAASKVSESLIGSEPGVVEQATQKASQAVVGSQVSSDSLSSAASEKASSVVSAAKHKKDEPSKAVLGTPKLVHESVMSEASSSIKSAAFAVSGGIDNAASEKPPKKVWGGAMAQRIVEERKIIYDDVIEDDDRSYSEIIQSMVGEAGEKASELTQVIADVLSKPTKTQGSVEAATSIANEQYERALSAASIILYGTQQGTAESLASAASDRYAQAVTAASYAIYGSPTPMAASLAAEAQSSYEAAISIAQQQYSIAKSRASQQISGTPKPIHEQMLSSIEKAYSGSLEAASQRLQDALQYTNTVKNYVAPTQGVLESISSVASSRLAEGLSQASAQYTSAKIAVGVQPTPAGQRYMAEAERQYYQAIGLAHARYSEFVEAASSAVYGTPTPAYQSIINQASSSIIGTPRPAYKSYIAVAQNQYAAAIEAASVNMQAVLDSAKSVAGSTSKSPAQSVLDAASSQYDAAVAAAAAKLSAASEHASTALYGAPTGSVESIASVISEKAESVASVASGSVVGTETPWTESIASQASQNWDSLISRASEQIYGKPTPWSDSLYSQAGAYGSQATDAAASQYSAVQALISDLVIGREPDFTESVMGRLSSAFYTGAPNIASSASSYASDAYASASSVVSTIFTPPPTLEAIYQSATDQLNSAVDAASVQIYGTEKGTIEKATEAAASAYSSAASQASEKIYGTQPNYVETAQNSIADALSSAQNAISVAFYGTPTSTIEAATSGASSVYSSISSVASENADAAASAVADSYNAAASAVSNAIYGPEQGALESATSRLSAAVESARARLAEYAGTASGAAAENVASLRGQAEEMASSISSAASSVTARVRDEL
ncbi:hypothetical protein M501DRAFT_1000231 [Patellaria atrata CBS 101060]|uniref:Transcription factor hoxa13 n=1 Tax=Patellaria atrata CBS 101060 TaxID=1346257 RepID=A0A9P4S1L9_9PEZI|nr:hypothetical protein M501DRAFT_1000231 [Patellaria atrata CBS 101060]